MVTARDSAAFLVVIFTLLTAWSAGVAVWQRRDAHRLNILALVGTAAAGYWIRRQGHPVLWTIGEFLWMAPPYFLLRLVRHFRDVSRVLLNGTLAAAVLWTVALEPTRMGGPLRGPSLVLAWAVHLYQIGIYSYIAVALTRQAHQTAGVTAHRLTAAAMGTWCFVYTAVVWTLYPILERSLGVALGEWGLAAGYAAYYVAFATPRRLRVRWQQAEQAQYLSATADRDTEDRGRRAPADLLEAACRSVGNSLVLVAFRSEPNAEGFVVRAASDRGFTGAKFAAGGVIERVVGSGIAEMTGSSDSGPELASRLTPLGNRLLVAPIATSSRLWGVVIVVQRRGALFPEDDLLLLSQQGRYAAIALDHAALVTEAKERERRRADIRLQAIEVRTRLMLDSITDYAMFIVDPDGLVVTWNAGAAQVFGYKSEEMTGESAAELYNLPSDHLQGRLHEALQLGRAVWEGPCRRKSGDRFLGSTLVRPLAGELDLSAFVVITRDVSEQRRLEEQLRQSQKMEAIGQLAGGIAHDFNNMLLAIAGNADLLALDSGEDPGRMEQITEIQRAVERAEALTRRLLAFGRRQNLQPAAVSLSSLVTDLLPMLRRVIAEHIEVVADTSHETRPVLGDRSQLEQVIVNLVVNARDAMPYGGRLHIRTGTEWLDEGTTAGEVPPGAYVVLEVTDTGVGMDPETQERIFEPFFTTKGYGQGTGLGLATVYGIVKQMGGIIRVRSQQGHGTTFRIYLPETKERAIQALPPSSAPPPRGHETLLLVEDDTAVRTFLVRTLERQGYKVLSADHPTAALAMVEGTKDAIDLVITDVVLPGLVGPEFVRALAELRAGLPPLPVLYISGYAEGSPVWQGEVPKTSHFLQKPFSARELLLRIREILPPAHG